MQLLLQEKQHVFRQFICSKTARLNINNHAPFLTLRPTSHGIVATGSRSITKVKEHGGAVSAWPVTALENRRLWSVIDAAFEPRTWR